jgi:hypothetical protein
VLLTSIPALCALTLRSSGTLSAPARACFTRAISFAITDASPSVLSFPGISCSSSLAERLSR